jgi:uncharacterized protein YbjT (DUF2867 family)
MSRSPALLITGATGRVGRLLVRELENRRVPFRALVRDPDRAAGLLNSPVAHLVRGDLREPDSIDAALDGIERVFLSTVSAPDQVVLQGNAIEAVERTGRAVHVVMVSALGAVPADVPLQLARWHAVTEAQLRSTDLPGTLLRPQFLMQNLLRAAPSIRTDHMLCGAFSDARLPLVDGRDLAAVAADVLTTDGHTGATYVLTGPQALSYTEVAATFSAVLGGSIRYVDMPTEAYHEYLVGSGLAHWMADDLVTIARSFRAGYTGPVTADVARVTGRPARTLAAFVEDHADAFRSAVEVPAADDRSGPCATTFWSAMAAGSVEALPDSGPECL